MIYFASDVHLGLGDKALARVVERRFVTWLDTVAVDAEAVVLVGDLFDFWYEYRRVVPKGYTRVLGKIAELTDRGIRVIFFTGNHDMWVGDYLSRECGMEVYTSPRQMTMAGRQLFVAHGDNMNIYHKPMLRLMNWTFRSSAVRALFSALVHPDLAQKFGRWWSARSRRRHLRTPATPALTAPLVEFATDYAACHKVDYFVFGHFHAAYTYSESGVNIVFLGNWESKPTYAVLSDKGVLTLKTFQTE